MDSRHNSDLSFSKLAASPCVISDQLQATYIHQAGNKQASPNIAFFFDRITDTLNFCLIFRYSLQITNKNTSEHK